MTGTATPLAGRVIAVTGAGRGIGRAVAHTLAAAGARVALGDLDHAAAVGAAAQAPVRGGGAALGLPLDVTDTGSFRDFLDQVEERWGPVDVLVNNAGIMWVGPFAAESEPTAHRQFEVNLHGVLRGMKLAAPRMAARGRGQIVNIASAASKLAPKGEATYAATKHAVYGYSTAVRAELRGSGVRVSVVMPAVVDTELAVGTSHGATRRLTPQDVADAVLRVVRCPVDEVFVPRHVGLVPFLSALLPARAAAFWQRLVVPDQLTALTDPALRTDYERGITTTDPTEPPRIADPADPTTPADPATADQDRTSR